MPCIGAAQLYAVSRTPGTASTAARTSRRYRFSCSGSGICLDRHRQPHREDVGRVEAGIDVQEAEEAAHHQPGHDEQHEGQGDFSHDQRIAQASPPDAPLEPRPSSFIDAARSGLVA